MQFGNEEAPPLRHWHNHSTLDTRRLQVFHSFRCSERSRTVRQGGSATCCIPRAATPKWKLQVT